MWLISAGAFAASVFVHSVAAHQSRHGGTVLTFVAIGIPIGILFIACGFFLYGFTPAVLAGALLYALACELYLFLFTLVGNSVSVRLLAELQKRPLKADEILSIYQTERMVERRFDQLQQSNLLISDQGRFRLTPRGRKLVSIFGILRAVCRRPEKTNGGSMDLTVH